MTSTKRKKYVISSLLVALLLLVTVTSARVDLNSYTIDLSNKNQLRYIFYDSAGNDSTLYFDSDTHENTRMKINGTTGMINITENLTMESFTIPGVGFVKNLANGKLTGGNSILIGDISAIGDGRWLKLDGSNANTDINIGIYDFTTTGNINASAFHGDGGNLTNISTASDDWNRSGTTLYTYYDGDSVQINSTLYTKGNITMEGNRTINATENLTIGNPGDIVLGDGTLRSMYPETHAKMNLGTNAKRFNTGYFVKLDSTGGVDPPYVLFNRETLPSILNRINIEISKDDDIKWDGLVLYGDGKSMFALNPKSGHREQFVWKSDYDALEQRVTKLELLIQELMN